MAARGYCTEDDVAAFLGQTLTTAQQAQALSLLETVEGLIDGETGRGWLVGAQTDETFRPRDWPDALIYLQYVPVTTLTEVRGRPSLDEDDQVLVADTDYEVMDLAAGVLRLIDPCHWNRVQVDYTPADTVPSAVRDAAAEWIAALMQPSLRPDTYGLESFSVPDLTVKFARGATGGEMPSGVALKLGAVDHYPDFGGFA